MPATITIPADVGRIDDARRFVTGHARSLGLDEDGVADIELAVTEALANVIEHAYGDRAPGDIEIAAGTDDEVLVVRIRDWGEFADPSNFDRRDLDDPGDGGYGVLLMEQLVDQIQREPAPGGGTLLTLTKHRKEQHHG